MSSSWAMISKELVDSKFASRFAMWGRQVENTFVALAPNCLILITNFFISKELHSSSPSRRRNDEEKLLKQTPTRLDRLRKSGVTECRLEWSYSDSTSSGMSFI